MFPNNPADPKWAANRDGVVGQMCCPLLDKAVWAKESSMAAVFTQIYDLLKNLPPIDNQQLWLWNCLFAEHCVKNKAAYEQQAASTAAALNGITVSKGF